MPKYSLNEFYFIIFLIGYFASIFATKTLKTILHFSTISLWLFLTNCFKKGPIRQFKTANENFEGLKWWRHLKMTLKFEILIPIPTRWEKNFELNEEQTLILRVNFSALNFCSSHITFWPEVFLSGLNGVWFSLRPCETGKFSLVCYPNDYWL